MYRILLSYLGGIMNNHRKFFKKTDLLLIGGLCVLALILLLVVTLSSPKGTTAQIYLHDVCVMTCDLSEDSIFQIDQAPEVTFQIQDGKIRFLSSDCPDQVCVRTRLYQPCRANRCLSSSPPRRSNYIRFAL